ncbi:MAG: RluA family pseudouridine synthase, partial [bacterium]|nr:RluA family pseudouridine synthase [bacterium]
YLQRQLPDYSRSRLQSWVKQGRVLVDGVPAKPSALLRGTESIEVEPAELPPLKAFAEELPLQILYEDPSVVAVNKPAGMVVHVGAGNHSGTLVNALLHRFEQLSQVGGDLRPGIVHRLDRFTSGVILVARNDKAHRALAAQFAKRKVEKIYLALVHGRLRADNGRIDTPIMRDPRRRTRMTTKLGTGRTALTIYHVRERLDKHTFLEIRIGTGRTHQIRVHLSSIGHPVVGDRLYGAPAAVAGLGEPDRFFLHAHRIGFRSPATQRDVVVEAPLASELEGWLTTLRG